MPRAWRRPEASATTFLARSHIRSRMFPERSTTSAGKAGTTVNTVTSRARLPILPMSVSAARAGSSPSVVMRTVIVPSPSWLKVLYLDHRGVVCRLPEPRGPSREGPFGLRRAGGAPGVDNHEYQARDVSGFRTCVSHMSSEPKGAHEGASLATCSRAERH